jgi:hypothetical protein
MIYTPKESHGKLKPQMAKAPKNEGIGEERRELSSTEKGMIVAFFVVFGVIATVFTIIAAPAPL